MSDEMPLFKNKISENTKKIFRRSGIMCLSESNVPAYFVKVYELRSLWLTLEYLCVCVCGCGCELGFHIIITFSVVFQKYYIFPKNRKKAKCLLEVYLVKTVISIHRH